MSNRVEEKQAFRGFFGPMKTGPGARASPGHLSGHLGGHDTCDLEGENGLMRGALGVAHGLDGGACTYLCTYLGALSPKRLTSFLSSSRDPKSRSKGGACPGLTSPKI